MADDIQNIKIRIVGEADFSQLDQSINKLTAEEKKLTDQLKAVDSAAKDSNKSIQDQANQSTQAVNNTNKSFDELREKVKGVASQMPGAFAVNQIKDFANTTKTAVAGISAVSGAMNVLKIAFASTGIGALILAVSSLVAYFKQTDEGATQLEGIFGALGAVIKLVTGSLVDFAGWLIDAASSADGLQNALKDLGDFIVDQFVNRFTSLTKISEGYAKLLRGDIKGGVKDVTDGMAALTLGIEDGYNKLVLYVGEIEAAAKAAYQFAIDLDAVNDRARDLALETAKVNQEVTNLIIQSKNKSKTDEERIALLQKANKLEEDNINKVIENETKRRDLLKARNEREQAYINKKVERELKAAKTEEERREIEEERLHINDDLADELNDQEIKLINLQTESANIIERNQNRIDAIREAAEAKNKAAADRKQKQLDEQAKKAEEAAKREELAYENLIEFRIAQDIKAKDQIAKSEEETTEVRIKAVQDRIQKEIELAEAQRDYLINIKKVTGSEALLVEEQLDAKRKEAVEKGEKEINDIYKKANDERLKEEEKTDKEAAAKRAAIYQASYQLLTTITNGFFDLQKANISEDLNSLKSKQEQELKAVGDNKQAQAVINAKFAREEAKLKQRQAESDKAQAIFNIILSTAQAVAKANPVLPLMALAAALGGAQLAFVASKPIPKFNKGTKSVPGYDTGDDSILAMLRPGEGVMPVDRMKDYRPAFNAIFDRKVPADFLNSMVLDYDRMGRALPVSSGNDISGIQSELKGLRKDISKLQVLQVTMDQKGFRTYLSSGNSKSQIENNYLRAE